MLFESVVFPTCRGPDKSTIFLSKSCRIYFEIYRSMKTIMDQIPDWSRLFGNSILNMTWNDPDTFAVTWIGRRLSTWVEKKYSHNQLSCQQSFFNTKISKFSVGHDDDFTSHWRWNSRSFRWCSEASSRTIRQDCGDQRQAYDLKTIKSLGVSLDEWIRKNPANKSIFKVDLAENAIFSFKPRIANYWSV